MRLLQMESLLPGFFAMVMAIAGCAQTGGSAPANHGGLAPGMDAAGNVVDASQVEAGHGAQVKGINDFSGEITGRPAPNSPFARLQIGMGLRQVVDIVGPPTDQGAYITGKAFIPFYFGSDRQRLELIYKGRGRLIFAGGMLGDYSGGNLIWIINSQTEPGYR